MLAMRFSYFAHLTLTSWRGDSRHYPGSMTSADRWREELTLSAKFSLTVHGGDGYLRKHLVMI